MARMPEFWDYLVLTASNDAQARAYEAQLAVRRETGHLVRVRQTLVVADLEGKRIGSGASTLDCLARIVARERRGGASPAEVLGNLRILIIHAGGDSRRLPAYSPCGKIFVPVPGESHAAFGLTLFDLLAPAFLALPPGAGEGQVVVTSGDALNRFDASGVGFGPGMTLLGAWATPEEASRHGVFCMDGESGLRLYLQKPSLAEQAAMGAINAYGETVLDIGITNLDGAAAAALLDAFHAFPEWQPGMRERILCQGLDLYREICCALGSEATFEHFARNAHASGSRWDDAALAAVFPALQRIPVRAGVLPGCSFLHFGSTRELVSTGVALATQDRQVPPGITALSVNNEIGGGGSIAGAQAWVEGCRLAAPLTLAGHNVVTGIDVTAGLALPERACLNLVEGPRGWFVECYGIDDSFKDARFCGRPLAGWLDAVGATRRDVWRTGRGTDPLERPRLPHRKRARRFPPLAVDVRARDGDPGTEARLARRRAPQRRGDRASGRPGGLPRAARRHTRGGDSPVAQPHVRRRQPVFRGGPGLRPAPRRRPRGVGGRHPGTRAGA